MNDAESVVRSSFSAVQADLERLVAIPGVSAAAFSASEVRRSASAVAEILLGYGLDKVQLLESGGHPAVYGEAAGPSGAPTIFVYGHHDVQPPGREERWLSPPFEAVVRDGRMFGRGTADDKGGFLACLSAIRACAELPCTFKVLIEGEEEIGSPHLPDLLAAHRDLVACDFVVLCDTPNFDTGVPALTYRLRGNCLVDVEVRCLDRPVHSGQAGGLAPDATMILCSMLASLAVPGLDPVPGDTFRALPFDDNRVRERFGLLEGVAFAGEASWESIWARPSLAVTAFESVPLSRAANQISDSARARLSLRTIPGMDTREAGHLLAAAIRSRASHGAHVDVQVIGGPEPWEADPHHPVFTLARRALSHAFGADAVMVGSGGSIGFVEPFAKLAGNIPPLLTGVQDPYSNAHSENESLHLGDWLKSMVAAVYLFQELAQYDPHSH